MKFELSEVPQVENTEIIEKEAVIKIVKEKSLTRKIIKVLLNGDPYYNFPVGEFNEELATKNEFFKLGNKPYAKGL